MNLLPTFTRLGARLEAARREAAVAAAQVRQKAQHELRERDKERQRE